MENIKTKKSENRPVKQSIRSNIAPLDQQTFMRGVGFLCDRDPDLARIVADFGPPPMWERDPGFPTLIKIILEQQVSLASAGAAYDRLLQTASPLTPARFLELNDQVLKTIGFSRQKTAYGRNLARTIVSGDLNLDILDTMDNKAVRSTLIKIKGIGPWTANIYLLMVLRRPDIWPQGDLALAVAAQDVKQLDARPTPDELEALSAVWKPWRAVAARLLWHHYLSCRRK